MEGRDSRLDGRIARDRCIEALAGSSDPDERLALWKAAKRYGQKWREATVEKSAAPLTRAGIAVGRRVVPR